MVGDLCEEILLMIFEGKLEYLYEVNNVNNIT